MIIISLIFSYFIFCEILVTKGIIPRFMKQANIYKIIVYAISIILICVLIGKVFDLMIPLLLGSTLYLGTVITEKYLNVFSDLEKGRRV